MSDRPDLFSLHLCVDMDETLIQTDVLWEGIKQLMLAKPWLLPWFILWLILQRAAAKAWLARAFPIDVATLRYRTDLVTYLTSQKALGRKLYLVSAANERIVKEVADACGLFDEVYGSDAKTNLKGIAKAQAIQQHISRNFVYAGDSFADLLVWREARGAILCGKALMFEKALTIPVEARFP